MNAPGQSTSAVGKSISVELNKMGYDLYYDHKKEGGFTGTIALSVKNESGGEEAIGHLDMAVVERNSNKAIALIEIEETTDNPKKLIGDIFAVLMGDSIYPPKRDKVKIGKWTTLIILSKDAGHGGRNELIAKMALGAKSSFERENSKIGDIVVKSFSEKNPLKDILMEKIKKAISRNV
jgi:hypothetical protein